MNSRKSGFYRGVALFFVVFVLADILFSPPNSEQYELLGIPLINVAAFDARETHQGTQCILVSGCQQEQPQQSDLPDSDCLSWCPHVLPSSPFGLDVQSVTALTTNQNALLLLSPPPQSMFHPPRFV